MAAKLGGKYRIGDDGWWHLTEGVPILTSDELEVVDINDQFITLKIMRDGHEFGRKPINLCFFDLDFEPETNDHQ